MARHLFAERFNLATGGAAAGVATSDGAPTTGTVHVFKAATKTIATVFATEQGGEPLTQPLELTLTGHAIGWVDDGAYDVTAADGKSRRVDTATPADARGIASVKARGALGDGRTNDTAAIQSAVGDGGVVFFPAGTYLIDRPIMVGPGTLLLGSGRDVTTIAAVRGATPPTFLHCEVSGSTPAGAVAVAHLAVTAPAADAASTPPPTGANPRAIIFTRSPADARSSPSAGAELRSTRIAGFDAAVVFSEGLRGAILDNAFAGTCAERGATEA